MRISDWSSDVCSSDLARTRTKAGAARGARPGRTRGADRAREAAGRRVGFARMARCRTDLRRDRSGARGAGRADLAPPDRDVPYARGGLVELGWRPRRSASFTPALPARVYDIVISLRLGMNDGQYARPRKEETTN